MTTIEHYHAVFVSQRLHALEGLHLGSVYGSFTVDGRRKVHRRCAALMFVVVIAELPDQRTANRFVDVAKRIA